MSKLHYGKNVEWFLRELSAHEAGDIESAEIEVIGENDQGVEGFTTIDITLLAADAVSVISALQQNLAAVAAAHQKLRESMAAIPNTIRLDKGHTSLGTILSAAKRAYEESMPTDAILNEVRAEAIEDFGRYHNFSEKLFIQIESKKYAAKLRAGRTEGAIHD